MYIYLAQWGEKKFIIIANSSEEARYALCEELWEYEFPVNPINIELRELGESYNNAVFWI